MAALQQIEIRIAERETPVIESHVPSPYYLFDKKSVDNAKARIQAQRDAALEKCFLVDRDTKVLNNAGHESGRIIDILAQEIKRLSAHHNIELSPMLQGLLNNLPTWSGMVQNAWDDQHIPTEVQAAIDSRYMASHDAQEATKGKKNSGQKKLDLSGKTIADIPADEQAQGGPVKQMTVEEAIAEAEAATALFAKMLAFVGLTDEQFWNLTEEERRTHVNEFEASVEGGVTAIMQTITETKFSETGCGGPIALIGMDDVQAEVTDVTEVAEAKKLVNMTEEELAAACGETEAPSEAVPPLFPGEDEDWLALSVEDRQEWLKKQWEEGKTEEDRGTEEDESGKPTETTEQVPDTSSSPPAIPFVKPAGKNARKPRPLTAGRKRK